jgi:hypothetical protein
MSCGRDLNIVGAATRKSRVAICSLCLETVRGVGADRRVMRYKQGRMRYRK